MSRALAFWVLMLIWLVWGLVWHFGLVSAAFGPLGGAALVFVLFALLGWQVFGPPLH
jgi:hypothetical protein